MDDQKFYDQVGIEIKQGIRHDALYLTPKVIKAKRKHSMRSDERRVGKEWRARWSPDQ